MMNRQDSMYGFARKRVWGVFDEHLDGERSGIIAVVSEQRLGEEAREALLKGFAALGYGRAACTFMTILPSDSAASSRPDPNSSNAAPPSPAATESDRSADPRGLTDDSLLLILESLDPLILIATDSAAARRCAAIYRQELPLLRACRLFGREARAFADFTGLMADRDKKQSAWAQLKTLPHAPSSR